MSEDLYRYLVGGRNISFEFQEVYSMGSVKPYYAMSAPIMEGDWSGVPQENIEKLIGMCTTSAREEMERKGKRVV